VGQTIKCPHCGQRLGNTNAAGDVHLKVRGLVLKKDGTLVAFCKRCYQPVYPRRSDLVRGLAQKIRRDQVRAVLDEPEVVV
jgi:hypothetical protein